MAARQRQIADRMAADRKAAVVAAINKDSEVVRLERIVELLDNTIKWFVKDSGCIHRNYQHPLMPITSFGASATPQRVLDVLNVADKA